MVRIWDVDAAELLLDEEPGPGPAPPPAQVPAAAAPAWAPPAPPQRSAPPPPPAVDEQALWVERRLQWISKYVNLDATWRSRPLGTLSRYEQVFGHVTPTAEWGERFWQGMEELLQTYSHRPGQGARPCYFTPPVPLARAQALLPVSPRNPLGDKAFAAYVWEEPGGQRVVACQYILMYNTKPWWVHEDFVTYG